MKILKENRLYELFFALDASDLRQLSKFLRSPLFNKQNVLVSLFDYLRAAKGRVPLPEKLFRHLYPDEPFNMQKLHYAHSDLLKKIEAFLVWKECTTSDIDFNFFLMKAYRKRNLEKPFLKVMSRIEQMLEKGALRNEFYHQNWYNIHRERFYFESAKKRNKKFKLQELADLRDVSFISGKLKDACNIISHQTIQKEEYDQGLLESVLLYIQNHPEHLEIPAIGVYHSALMALTHPEDESAFTQLKILLRERIDLFSQQEKRDIFILATNYCIRRLNAGKKRFVREAFEVYREGLRMEIYLDNGILSKWTYNNVILLGFKLKEFEWVYHFIYEYKERLDEKTREDSFHFNLSKYYFEVGNFDQAMPLLLQTKYSDVLHHLGAKVMLAKMYYDLDEWEALESLLESLKVYISRKKEIGYHKENYLNIISMIKKIIQIPPSDKIGIVKLEQQIKDTKVLSERDWLLEKMKELK